MEEPEKKDNVIPFRPRKPVNETPIISSDYWGDMFPIEELLAAIDRAKANKDK